MIQQNTPKTWLTIDLIFMFILTLVMHITVVLHSLNRLGTLNFSTLEEDTTEADAERLRDDERPVTRGAEI